MSRWRISAIRHPAMIAPKANLPHHLIRCIAATHLWNGSIHDSGELADSENRLTTSRRGWLVVNLLRWLTEDAWSAKNGATCIPTGQQTDLKE
jgi:hypothetical protein